MATKRWEKGDELKEPCLLCGGVLVVRQNSKNGILFVGCRSFPSCTVNRPLQDDDRNALDPMPATDEARKRADSYTGTMCSVCNQPQFLSPHGVVCTNGHGGAPGVDPGSGEKVDADAMFDVDHEGISEHVKETVEMMRVELTYFKDTGKYYTEGHFLADFSSFESLVQRVDEMHRTGRLPGLVEGAGKGFFVLVQPPDGGGSHGVPHLLRPVDEARCDRCGSEDAEERLSGAAGVLCGVCWRAIIQRVVVQLAAETE